MGIFSSKPDYSKIRTKKVKEKEEKEKKVKPAWVKWVKFSIVAILWLLFIYWLGSWWGLIVLTFIFVLTILGVTSKKANHGSFGGLIIGLTLTLVHIFGIGLTGTSVNPARSIAPAVLTYLEGNTDPLACLWVFILAPLVGSALAACTYKFLESSKAGSKK